MKAVELDLDLRGYYSPASLAEEAATHPKSR